VIDGALRVMEVQMRQGRAGEPSRDQYAAAVQRKKDPHLCFMLLPGGAVGFGAQSD